MWFGIFWLAEKKQPEDRGVVFGSIQRGRGTAVFWWMIRAGKH
jgi:hypothetical protein